MADYTQNLTTNAKETMMFADYYFYGPEDTDGEVYYEPQTTRTQCIGALLTSAQTKNYTADGKATAYKPLSEKEISTAPYYVWARSRTSIKLECEPVTLIDLEPLAWQDYSDEPFVNAYVWSVIPQSGAFVFPVTTKGINNLDCVNEIGHVMVGIAVPSTADDNVVNIQIWDPCGENKKYKKHTIAIAEAFNKLNTGKLFIATHKWEGKQKETMQAAPQVMYPKNGYCQTFAYIKIKDISQNGFPGALITKDDWEREFPDLQAIHNVQAQIVRPQSPHVVQRNDMDPYASTMMWEWAPKRFNEINEAGNPFVVMQTKQRDFDSHDVEEQFTPMILAAHSVGGRAVSVTRITNVLWHKTENIPEAVKRNPEIAKRFKENAKHFQIEAMTQNIFEKDIETINPDALYQLLKGKKWGFDFQRYYDTEQIDARRRIVIIEYILGLQGKASDWDTGTVGAALNNFCQGVWNKRNLQLMQREYDIIKHKGNSVKEGFSYFLLFDEGIREKIAKFITPVEKK